MKTKLMRLVVITFVLAVSALGGAATAQTGTAGKAPPPMVYHGGEVLNDFARVYLIWYGCWGQDPCSKADQADTMAIVTDFVHGVGQTPYFRINFGYPDSNGLAPHDLFYIGSSTDQYSRGATLTEADLDGIVIDQITSGAFPQDDVGIYVVLTSSDVRVEDATTQYCITCCSLHRSIPLNGARVRSVFVGNPARCPGDCAMRFLQSSPNANLGADGMATWLAYAFNGTVTNPDGNGWYDKNGLENADKCEGNYGPSWTVINPDGQLAQANIHVGPRDFLLQQNWVNERKGYCGMALPQ
jgi:hypothetical protein